jgi:hypothetical protein
VARRSLPILGRRAAIREAKPRFILFCERKSTEPAYFRALGRAVQASLILELEVLAGQGVAYTVAERASRRARELGLAGTSRRKRDSYEKSDQIWAVFDRDEHPNFADAVLLCQNNRVGIARSNPCFEIWLILHETEYDKSCDRRTAQRQFGSLHPEYDRDGSKLPDCDDLIRRLPIAEERAQRQLARREEEGAPFGIPSTTVHMLTRAMRAAFTSSNR